MIPDAKTALIELINGKEKIGTSANNGFAQSMVLFFKVGIMKIEN